MLRGLLVALALVLSGCLAGGADVAPTSGGASPPLPGPIHEERAVTASQGGAYLSGTGLPCGSSRACSDHPFSLPRAAAVHAALAWGVEGNMLWLRILRDGEQVASTGTGLAPAATSLVLNTHLPAGDYVLRVDPYTMVNDRYVLDVTFSESPGFPEATLPAPSFAPHTLVGVMDTGINPYHELFYRPHLTAHPCTYIRDIPCDLVELPLSVGMHDWHDAVEKDRALWESIEPGTWYWIPKTVFVAVTCGENRPGSWPTQEQTEDLCILDDFNAHGAMVTSILTMQDPDAYIAFQAGVDRDAFAAAGIRVDLFSVSLGSYVPRPLPASVSPCGAPSQPLYFQPAGNLAWAPHLHCFNSRPDKVVVGGGFTDPYAVDAQSGDAPEITSYFCPPYAPADRVFGLVKAGSWCGTSFATPTVAGAASRVILELRRASGYDGRLTDDGMLDPILGVTSNDLRDALNRTATYTPAPKYAEGHQRTAEPLATHAPWIQWGWGFYDIDQAPATVAHLLGTTPAPDKPADARQFMDTHYGLRQLLYGPA